MLPGNPKRFVDAVALPATGANHDFAIRTGRQPRRAFAGAANNLEAMAQPCSPERFLEGL
jgi:hypothetical protein